MDNKSEQKIYRKKCLEIVESVLTEEVVEKDLFVNNCLYITRNDYNDICIERSLIDLCGYPFCTIRLSSNADKNIFKSKQKYKIDSKTNKIYEIEERKQFCSNLCFKSSNYLKEQISEEPIYLRSDTQKQIRLYDKSCQQLGKEVLFDEEVVNQSKRLLKPKTDKTFVENKKLLSNEKQKQLIGFPYIKEEYLDQLKDQMKDLRINERLEPSKESEEKENCLKHSDPNQSQQKSDEKKTSKSCVSMESKLECVESVLKSWITSSTHEFIFGSKPKEITFEMIKQTDDQMVLEDEEKQKKLSEMRYNYHMLCAKLDLEEEKDRMIDDIILGKAKNGKSAEEYERQDLTTVYNDDFEAKVDAFKKGQMFAVRNRKVKFDDQKVEPETSSQLFIPPTDSQYFSHKRRQIILTDIDNCLIDLFNSSVLSELRSNIKDLIKTFHLNASNVSQNEDKLLMTLFLIRMLVIGGKVEDLDKTFDENPVLKALNDFKLNKSDIDQKIKSYFNQ